ncbi:hypothetical protein QKF51_10715 [Clavibacter michiganensis]|uniref:hypothetical protein n=1 Tax=Clavibacter michiganensis TaxID=28447 RepID=UPI0013667327|nr:hypothetical protein [Clavibacter michiganensis]MDO4075706.1 hypothetical protein [Clavibacter michiganensis]
MNRFTGAPTIAHPFGCDRIDASRGTNCATSASDTAGTAATTGTGSAGFDGPLAGGKNACCPSEH